MLCKNQVTGYVVYIVINFDASYEYKVAHGSKPIYFFLILVDLETLKTDSGITHVSHVYFRSSSYRKYLMILLKLQSIV
jgi:hypothetical protein